MCLATYSQSGSYWLFSLTDVKFHKLLKTSAKKFFKVFQGLQNGRFFPWTFKYLSRIIFSVFQGLENGRLFFTNLQRHQRKYIFTVFQGPENGRLFSTNLQRPQQDYIFSLLRPWKWPDYFPQTFKDPQRQQGPCLHWMSNSVYNEQVHKVSFA